MAVVLGLLLCRDRLATVRPRPLASGAREPALRPARGRVRRAHDLLEPQGLPDPAALLQRALAELLPDRDDPAAAACLGLADRGRRSGRRAADRRPGRMARGEPGPRRRRAALDRPARRVRPRRLAQVRSGLGPAGEWQDRVPAAGPPQSRSRFRRPPHPRPRRPGPLRGPGQHFLVALPAGAGSGLVDAGADRATLGRAPRSFPRRGAAGGHSPRRRSPAPRWPLWRCPTFRRRSAGAWSRSTC